MIKLYNRLLVAIVKTSLLMLLALGFLAACAGTQQQTPADVGDVASACNGKTVFTIGLTTVEYKPIVNVKCFSSGGPHEKPWDRQQ